MTLLISQNKINKRKIFYLSGYDPRGVRFYYNILKVALEKFTLRDCVDIELSAKQKISPLETVCQLNNKTDSVVTDYSFLHWDDFIKQTWIKSYYQLFIQGIINYYDIFTHLSWSDFLKLPRSPVITLLYPFLTLVTFPLLFTLFLAYFYNDYGTPLVYFTASCLLWIRYLPRLNSLWLLRFFIFNNQNFIHYNSIYDKRSQELADIITSSFTQDYDEIILLAHSNGTIASVPILKHLTNIPDNFKILTLAHCIPLITMNPSSTHYIASLKEVSTKKLKWFDIGFPPDGACYSKTNPLYSYCYKGEPINVDFLAVSPKFFKYYAQNDYVKLRKDKFKLHFAYLFTHDIKSPFEFIDILTHNTPLEIRFNHG